MTISETMTVTATQCPVARKEKAMKDAAYNFVKAGREREFRVVFALCYPLFFVGALVKRTLPRRRHALVEQRSIFGEASALAYRTLPYAF